MNFGNQARSLGIVDIALIKWSVLAFTLFVVSVWDGFAQWVIQTPWGWFLAASLALAAVPVYKFFK